MSLRARARVASRRAFRVERPRPRSRAARPRRRHSSRRGRHPVLVRRGRLPPEALHRGARGARVRSRVRRRRVRGLRERRVRDAPREGVTGHRPRLSRARPGVRRVARRVERGGVSLAVRQLRPRGARREDREGPLLRRVQPPRVGEPRGLPRRLQRVPGEVAAAWRASWTAASPGSSRKSAGPARPSSTSARRGPIFGADALKIPLGRAPSMGSSYAQIGGAALGEAGRRSKPPRAASGPRTPRPGRHGDALRPERGEGDRARGDEGVRGERARGRLRVNVGEKTRTCGTYRITGEQWRGVRVWSVIYMISVRYDAGRAESSSDLRAIRRVRVARVSRRRPASPSRALESRLPFRSLISS